MNDADPALYAYEVFIQLSSGRPLQYVGSPVPGEPFPYGRLGGCRGAGLRPQPSDARLSLLRRPPRPALGRPVFLPAGAM